MKLEKLNFFTHGREMKLHKIISHFFLLNCFLFSFFVFASNEQAPEGCSELNLTPNTMDCLNKCQDNYSTYCNQLLRRRQADTSSDTSGDSGDVGGEVNWDTCEMGPDYAHLCDIGVSTDREPAAADTEDASSSEETPSMRDVLADKATEKAADAVKDKAKSGAKDWFKKKLLGDKAKHQAENQKLQTTLRKWQKRCNAIYPHIGHWITCGGPIPPCKELSVLKRLCRSKDKILDLDKLTQLQSVAQDKLATLSENLASKLNMDPAEVRGDIEDVSTCGQAWQLAQLTCKFPVRALGGKVGNALNVIGKVAFVGQAVAGLAGKSLNDLCKALTTLSGAGVTISLLAQAKCAFEMGRCRKLCNTEKDQECSKLYTEQTTCLKLHESARVASCGSYSAPIVSSCGRRHMNLDKHHCRVMHINQMKGECSVLKKNAVAMMIDIVQLIATVKSAKMCWDKTGGNMSPSVDQETCRQMKGTPYKDETTGDWRCRFREPDEGEGKCPPYGIPLACDKPCEDGSVPAGCRQGVCENGEMVSCTTTCPPNGSVPAGCDTCPDPSLTYPDCDCNCPTGQTCNDNRQCVNPGGTCDPECENGQVCNAEKQCVDPGGGCTTSDDCGGDQVCNAEEQCVNPGGTCTTDDNCGTDQVCQDGTCVNTEDQICTTDDNCGTDQVCQDGTCVNTEGEICTTSNDCGNGQVCQDGTCVNTEGEICTTSNDCGNGQVCQDGTCVNTEGEICTTSGDCGPDKICQGGTCFCDCQGSPTSCSEQCNGVCLEESVSCPCQGNGECTPPQKCVTNSDGQNVCSDDDGEGVCPDGSRVACDQNCPGGSKPDNCRSCNGDSDCGENQICNRGVCTTEDPVLSVDGAGGGGAPEDNALGEEDPMAITNDGLGGGDGDDDPSNPGNTGNLPGASSGKQRKGLLGRLGALLGVGKGGGSPGFKSGRRGSKGVDKLAKGSDKSDKTKGVGAGGFGNYGAGGGGARNPAAGGFGLSAAQMKKLKKEKGNKRSAFPNNLGNIGGVHQDIFKSVTKRYQKLYKLK